MHCIKMAGLYTKTLSLASSLLIVSAIVLHSALYLSTTIWTTILYGLVAVSLLFVSLVYFWLCSTRPTPRQSVTTLTIHYLLSVFMIRRGKRIVQKCLSSCKSPIMHQRRLLRDVIQRNSNTVYGREHRFEEMTSLEEYRKRHPLTDYEHFRPYVDRIIDGEKDVLFQGEPVTFYRTTGTTGKSKYLPITREIIRFKIDIQIAALNYVVSECYKTERMRKSLYFYVAPKVQTTKRGIAIEPVGRLPVDCDWLLAGLATPLATFRITTMHEAYYVQLLYGLLDSEIQMIIVGFVSFLERVINLLKKNWRDLVTDIEQGTINADLTLPAEVRSSLTAELRRFGGDPQRAAFLRGEFEKGFQGIFKRIWPSCRLVCGVDAARAWPKLSASYAKGLALGEMGYGSTEAVKVAISPGPKFVDRGYIPLVNHLVLEFIKECDISEEQPQTRFVNEVEVGVCYEVVITQRSGLYRYRTGDVVRIISFYDNMPVLEFMYRTGQLLNLVYEKLDQIVVVESVRAAAGQWPDGRLVEFATAESTMLPDSSPVLEAEEIMPYYLFFVELDNINKILTDDEKDLIDVELKNRNNDYDRLRREGAISRPRVYTVQPRTFVELQHFLITKTSATANQYKLPRKLRTPDMVEFITSKVVHN